MQQLEGSGTPVLYI